MTWDKICDPKIAGGLNITPLLEWNQATMSKLLWNLQVKANKLWVKWIDVYYLKNQDVMTWKGTQITHGY